MAISIDIPTGREAEALVLARIRFEQRGKSLGIYGSNNLERHRAGALGEAAIVDWAWKRFLHVVQTSNFPTVTSVADVTIDNCRVEIKTFRKFRGGTIDFSPIQLPRISSNSDVVAVCQLMSEPPGAQVDLVGFITIGQLLARGVPKFSDRNTPVYSLRLAHLEEPDLFKDFLASFEPNLLTPGHINPSNLCVKRHEAWGGICWTCSAMDEDRPTGVIVNVHKGSPVFHGSEETIVRSLHRGTNFVRGLELRAIGDVATKMRPCAICFGTT